MGAAVSRLRLTRRAAATVSPDRTATNATGCSRSLQQPSKHNMRRRGCARLVDAAAERMRVIELAAETALNPTDTVTAMRAIKRTNSYMWRLPHGPPLRHSCPCIPLCRSSSSPGSTTCASDHTAASARGTGLLTSTALWAARMARPFACAPGAGSQLGTRQSTSGAH